MAGRSFRLNVMPPKGAPFQVPLDGEMLIGRDGAATSASPTRPSRRTTPSSPARESSIAIKDLDSTNGTVVAGRPLRGEQWLREKMLIEIGVFHLELIPEQSEPGTTTEPLPKQVIRFDERDRGVANAILADWTDPAVQAPAARGAEEVANDLHCSRQEANRRIARMEQKLGLEKGKRGAARYHRLAEELLRRGFGPERA